MRVPLADIQINPNINLSEYTALLAQNGRVQIKNFLTKDSAEKLHQLLVQNQTWYLAYNEGDNYVESKLSDYTALAPELKNRFMNNIYRRASTSFQYVFTQYFITQAVEKGEEPGHPLHVMHDFVNGDRFMPFMKTLTGDDSIRFNESFASMYAPGHFLTDHDDTHAKNDRVVAYTISMTPIWNKDWGGHVAFFDEEGNINQAFIPDFNSLNVFTIPQPHAVQMVTPFARANRMSFLGWANR